MDKENLVDSPQGEKRKHISRMSRIGVFVVFWFILLCNCSDGGIPSASSNHVKKDLDLDDTSFGKFGSLVQIGRISGTFLVIVLFKLLNKKYLLFIAVTVKASSYVIYLFTKNKMIIYTFRVLQGLSHVFPYNYYPTWTDQFGIRKYKTMFIAVMQNASPIGSVFGFGLANTLGTSNWKFAFLVDASIMMFFNVIALFLPMDYYKSDLVYKGHYYRNGELLEEGAEQRKNESVLSYFGEGEVKKKNKALDIVKVPTLLLNPMYLFVTLSRTVLMFIFMAIHYWLGDYYTNVLKVTEEQAHLKTLSYTLISSVGPLSGTFIGTPIATYFGGYETKACMYLCLVFSFCTCCSAFILPFMNTLLSFVICIFAFFLFANCMMPILIGLCFATVSNDFKDSAYPLNSLLCTFLGNFPSTTIYGYLNQKYKETDNKFALRCVMNYIWVNFILLCITACIRAKKSDKPKEVKTQKGTELAEVEK